MNDLDIDHQRHRWVDITVFGSEYRVEVCWGFDSCGLQRRQPYLANAWREDAWEYQGVGGWYHLRTEPDCHQR